jgi:mannose-6-phosphate isomerase-like protein (cupin superfamily)
MIPDEIHGFLRHQSWLRVSMRLSISLNGSDKAETMKMKKRTWLLIFPALVLPALLFPMPAGDPQGFTIWKSSDLKGYAAKLSPKINDKKIATENLSSFDGYLTMVAHREGSGEAELHQKMADLIVVETGEGTLVVGGTIPNSRTTAPGEVRGAAVQGGQQHRVTVGDVVHIPPDVPHQMLVDKGREITYFVVKI